MHQLLSEIRISYLYTWYHDLIIPCGGFFLRVKFLDTFTATTLIRIVFLFQFAYEFVVIKWWDSFDIIMPPQPLVMFSCNPLDFIFHHRYFQMLLSCMYHGAFTVMRGTLFWNAWMTLILDFMVHSQILMTQIHTGSTICLWRSNYGLTTHSGALEVNIFVRIWVSVSLVFSSRVLHLGFVPRYFASLARGILLNNCQGYTLMLSVDKIDVDRLSFVNFNAPIFCPVADVVNDYL